MAEPLIGISPVEEMGSAGGAVVLPNARFTETINRIVRMLEEQQATIEALQQRIEELEGN